MTNPPPTATYGYVADGTLPERIGRAEAALYRKRQTIGAGIVLAFGTVYWVLTLDPGARNLPVTTYLVIYLIVCFGLLALVAVFYAITAPVVRALARRRADRQFPQGSTTEVELGPEELTIRRPDRNRSAPYPDVVRAKPHRGYLVLRFRRRPLVELLPPDLLPQDAIQLILLRSRGLRPNATLTSSTGDTTREFIVPAGWCDRVALAGIAQATRTSSYWVRIGTYLLLSVVIARLAGDARLLTLGPLLAVASMLLPYVLTRNAVRSANPVGSRAVTLAKSDRFITQHAQGEREIRFDDIAQVRLIGEVAYVEQISAGRPITIARTLLPDEVLGMVAR